MLITVHKNSLRTDVASGASALPNNSLIAPFEKHGNLQLETTRPSLLAHDFSGF
jgi:hypothetical protein